MKKVSIILPTYCESGNIVKLTKALIKYTKAKNYKIEIIIVDDNSPDGTATEARKLIKQKLPVKLFVRKKQKGLATAIALGVKKATGNIIVLMDTDFNHQPKDVPRLLQAISKNKAAIVIGSRYIPGGNMHITEANKLQFFLSKNGNLFINRLLLRLPIHESLSGFLAFKKSIFTKLKAKTIFQGYGDYCIRLLYKAYKQNFKIIEIPVVYGKRHWGKSKTKLFKIFIEYFKTAVLLKLNLA